MSISKENWAYMSQAEFSRLTGYTRARISQLWTGGDLVKAGKKIDVTASLRKLLNDQEAKKSIREETEKWRTVRLQQQCQAYDETLKSQIKSEVLRDLGQRLRKLKAIFANAGKISEELRQAIVAAINEVILDE